MTLQHLIGLGPHLAWWQEAIRAIAIFAYGLAIVRIAGRRVFGKWSALDIIVSVIVGSNLSRALTGNADLGGTLLGTTILMVLHWMLANAVARSNRLSDIVEGCPIHLGHNGTLQQRTLLRESVSEHDLSEALRQSGVEHVRDTKLVVLEPSGRITVVK